MARPALMAKFRSIREQRADPIEHANSGRRGEPFGHADFAATSEPLPAKKKRSRKKKA